MIVFSPNSSTPANARATISCDLPFCRGAEIPTNFDAHRPSVRSPIAASSADSCHSSSGIRKDAAMSATSSHELARALGATRTLGGAGPSSSTPRRDLVDAIALRLLGLQLFDLSQRGPILRHQSRPTVHRSL